MFNPRDEFMLEWNRECRRARKRRAFIYGLQDAVAYCVFAGLVVVILAICGRPW